MNRLKEQFERSHTICAGLYHSNGIVFAIPKETPTTHKLGKLISLSCANCANDLVSFYETDIVRGGRIADNWRYCSICGARLDFGDLYAQRSADNEIIFEDEKK